MKKSKVLERIVFELTIFVEVNRENTISNNRQCILLSDFSCLLYIYILCKETLLRYIV